MTPPAATREESRARFARTFSRVVPAAVVFGMFLAFSVIRAPLPAVNEPHFLAKAKHYWDPAWCPGDLFLDSADAHLVYFQAIGLVAQVLSLEATAWLGRVAGLALLAAAWTALVRRIVPGSAAPIAVAAVFLFFAAVGNLSGEWLIGGVEAKVFGYAFVFFALAATIDRRWIAAGAWGGAAIALHPVVGMWSLLAGIGAIIAMRIPFGRDPEGARTADTAPDHQNDRTYLRVAFGVVLLVLIALSGLLPAFAMLGEGDDQVQRAAGYIQVARRLSHHLDPLDFRPWSWVGYAGLTAIWIVGWRLGAFDGRRRLLAWFVLASFAFALAGLAIGLRSEPLGQTPFQEIEKSRLDILRIRLLRFYPFRLYDLLAPIAAAMVVVLFASGGRGRAAEAEPDRARRVPLAIGCVLLFAISLALPAADREPSRYSADRLADWIEVCRWIEANTPGDTEFVTPDTPAASWAFHWYAQRAEYVSYKNCPQDALALVEWNRRFQVIHLWATDHYADGRYDDADLRELAAKTGADYLLTDHLGPMTVQPIHANGTYRLYRLDPPLANGVAP